MRTSLNSGLSKRYELTENRCKSILATKNAPNDERRVFDFYTTFSRKPSLHFMFAKQTFPCVRVPTRTLYTLSVKRKGKERGGVQGIDGGFLGLFAEDLFNGVRVIGELGLVAVEKEVARLVAVL